MVKRMVTHCKFGVKSSGARMFGFSWEGLVLGPDLSDFYKLGASLPASLAGEFFPRKRRSFFIYAKPRCL